MAVTIKLRYIRHSAKKLRPLARVIVGKKLNNALSYTEVLRNDSAQFINKALKMVAAAAEQKEFKKDDLVVTEINATEGPKIKRMRPNARGRSNKYQKHVAHLVISVGAAKVETKKIVKPKEKNGTQS